jgi:hypothetical protein
MGCGCGVSFRQLQTCRATRSGRQWANKLPYAPQQMGGRGRSVPVCGLTGLFRCSDRSLPPIKNKPRSRIHLGMACTSRRSSISLSYQNPHTGGPPLRTGLRARRPFGVLDWSPEACNVLLRCPGSRDGGEEESAPGAGKSGRGLAATKQDVEPGDRS